MTAIAQLDIAIFDAPDIDRVGSVDARDPHGIGLIGAAGAR